jgi:FkbM family methyltransferase
VTHQERLALIGEVVQQDCYRVMQLPFVPQLVLDIGANVGIFTTFARLLFPGAAIVAMEPDARNVTALREIVAPVRIVVDQCALGFGDVWRQSGAANGAMEVYRTQCLGFPDPGPTAMERSGYEWTAIKSVPFAVILAHWRGFHPVVAKVDCEGAENSIFESTSGMKALATVDYIAMELHFYANDGSLRKQVRRTTFGALRELQKTHHVELDGMGMRTAKMLYALKRGWRDGD